ncbi:MAG: hypothetical protein PHI77_00870 [Candidatus Pacebacteria bacterium]|nr:hypothetical protein [Candidatus Paceibacterota bacterium]
MKIKKSLAFFAAAAGLMGAVFAFAEDQNASSIQYPVEELGGCADQQECKAYCDKKENIEVCLSFAEKNNLLSQEEIESAQNFLKAGNKGPGGCEGKEACEAYCSDIDNIDECVAFAEKNGLMPEEKLQEAKKVQAAIAKGITPPACGNKEECDVYCQSSEHMEECVAFGEAAGFLQGEELEKARKMLSAVKRGVKAPPCNGKEECDAYCSKPENMELCINFSIEAGFMAEEEKANAQKMLQALAQGAVPPNCKGKEECEIYCTQEEHIEECISFSEAAGLMSAEDAAMARKTGGKGPGGCSNKEECENFCGDPANKEACFNFAKENGLIPQGELEKMEEGSQQMKESLAQAPAEVLECLISLLGADAVEKMKNGDNIFSKGDEEKMKDCFEKNIHFQETQGDIEDKVPFTVNGPGGCSSIEECQAYCQANPQDCMSYQEPKDLNAGNQVFSEQMQKEMQKQMQEQMQQHFGPGGCQSPEECQAYCSSHPEECASFQGLPSMPMQEMNNLNPQMPSMPVNMENLEGFQAPMEMQNMQTQQPMQKMEDEAEPSGAIKNTSLLGSIVQAFKDFFKN